MTTKTYNKIFGLIPVITIGSMYMLMFMVVISIIVRVIYNV